MSNYKNEYKSKNFFERYLKLVLLYIGRFNARVRQPRCRFSVGKEEGIDLL